MMQYDVTGGTLTAIAKSSLHDTETLWKTIRGAVTLGEPLELSSATIAVQMDAFDAGSWLKNRHLKKNFPFQKYPTADFVLTELSKVSREGEKISAEGGGQVQWNGKTVPISLRGQGIVNDNTLSVRCQFTVDIRDFGLEAPGILGVKVDDVLECIATIEARAR